MARGPIKAQLRAHKLSFGPSQKHGRSWQVKSAIILQPPVDEPRLNATETLKKSNDLNDEPEKSSILIDFVYIYLSNWLLENFVLCNISLLIPTIIKLGR